MINMFEVNETNKMIEQENLDVRTITLGISLLDCIDSDLDKVNQNIYNKITTLAKDLVKTGKTIENRYSIPIVNFCNSDRYDWCSCLQKAGRLCDDRTDLRPCGSRSRCQLHWRIFRIGKQRYDNCG